MCPVDVIAYSPVHVAVSPGLGEGFSLSVLQSRSAADPSGLGGDVQAEFVSVKVDSPRASPDVRDSLTSFDQCHSFTLLRDIS